MPIRTNRITKFEVQLLADHLAHSSEDSLRCSTDVCSLTYGGVSDLAYGDRAYGETCSLESMEERVESCRGLGTPAIVET